MQAVVRDTYGSPDVLRLEEVATPTPGDDEILIRIRAVSLNLSDWELLHGKPLYARLFGLVTPRVRILGSDVAGRVEAVGRDVTRFAPGDEVFGDTFGFGLGGFAEYVAVPERAPLAHKPPAISFEDAASLPQAGVLALQGLDDIQPGSTVLINGAGGGAGTFAIQIARSLGAEVTGVDNAKKLELMRSLGADHIIDYTQRDFTRTGERYDHILDFAGHRSIFENRRALAPGGRYAMVGGSMSALMQTVLLGPLLSVAGHKKLGVLAQRQSRADLERLVELLQAGRIAPVIDGRHPLAAVPEALQHLGQGQALGKVVLTP